MIQITESDMLFEFEDSSVLHIEKSNLQKNIGDGIKTVEFIVRLKKGELDFVEAKSSSPKPTEENTIRVDEFIEDIANKFIHSFNLYLSGVLKKNITEDISDELKIYDYSNVKLKFILIIKEHKLQWLQPLKDALDKKLMYYNKIWKSQIVLMNEELAIQYKLVKAKS